MAKRALLTACGLVCGIAVAGRVQGQEQTAGASTSTSTRGEEETSFGAVARIKPEPQGEHRFERRESAVLRSSLGDSFDAAGSLPGTLPVFSGVPYLLVRGAPPSGTAQYYDGVPVPALFHLALGPEITHPSLIGGLTFHPGVAPARYGRRTGAVLVARGPTAEQRPMTGELEARLLDSHALLRTADPGLALHGRFAYPNALLAAVGQDATLEYWDYLARYEHALDARDRVTLLAFGAGDAVGDRREPDDDIRLQFHRVLARVTRSLPSLSLGGQVYAGYERGRLGSNLTGELLRIGPSTWVELQEPHDTRIRLGLDMEGKLSRVQHDQERAAQPPAQVQPGSPDSFLPDVSGVSLTAAPEDIVEHTPLAQRPARRAQGAYAELSLAPAEPVEVELGGRVDSWLIAGEPELAFDPRALVRVRALPWLGLHAGAGSAHQGAVSPIPLPGLSDLELDHGLQAAVQSEAGAEIELPGHFSLSATGFYHRFSHLVFLELIIDCEGNTDPLGALRLDAAGGRRVPLCQQRGLPRGNGSAYGVELLLRRSVLERFGGWLSYTLAFGDATAGDGTAFVPQYDVRHVLNAVLTQDWGAGWSSGLRLHYRSGKPAVNTVFDFVDYSFERLETRLPPFFRADASVSYGWSTSFGKLTISAQFLNATFSREATKRDCVIGERLRVVCRVDYLPAIAVPNLGVRAEL